MWNELLGSINELPVKSVSTQFSDVARGGKFNFEKRWIDGRGRHHVRWAYSMTIILPSGVVLVPPQSGTALRENPFS
jgi:hypothetical protein